MPLHCPRCQIAQAEENETCINCGQPLKPAPAAPAASFVDPALLAEADAAAHLADHDDPVASDPVHAVQARRAAWRLPALIAVGLLLALLASAFLAARRKPPVRAARAASAPAPPSEAAPPVPAPAPEPPTAEAKPTVAAEPALEAKTAAAKTVPKATPLTVTLASQSAGRHVKVGDNITLTAVTALAHGRSATLTLFSRRGHGEKTMLSFVQGSLCSTTWTPVVPGRYEFTATALGDRRQTATSRPVAITVDGPARQPDRPAPVPVAQHGAIEAPRPVSAVVPPRTVRLPPKVVTPRAARAPRPAHAPTYHVAAAQFAFSRSAVVLADALRQRGYPALPEKMADRHGKTVYVVVTGSFRRPKEARSAVLALQRSGYPAYLFSGR